MCILGVLCIVTSCCTLLRVDGARTMSLDRPANSGLITALHIVYSTFLPPLSEVRRYVSVVPSPPRLAGPLLW